MLNFGIVGCGRIAERHAELLGKNHVHGAKLAAVCDLNKNRALEFSKKYDVPAYTDMHEMMKKEKLDVVNVLTPSGMHADHVVSLAGYKKHIVVEKPMALTLADADAMIHACAENGSQLFVVKQNRFNLPVTKLREAVVAKRFGKPVLGTVRVRWCRDQKYYDQDSWRGTWALDGGALTNQASHHIDLLIWLMGDVESVFAKTATRLVNTETEDTGVVVLKFTSGALGIIEATTAARPKDLEGSVSILGENGTVEIGGFAVNEIRHWNFKDSSPEEHQMMKQFSTNPPNVYGFGHKQYLEHVVDCIENKKSVLVSGLEGRRSLEVITAIYESVETGKEVFLRFQPKQCRLGLK